MSNFTLPTTEQVFDADKSILHFGGYASNRICSATDFAILLGLRTCCAGDIYNDMQRDSFFVHVDGYKARRRVGAWWTNSLKDEGTYLDGTRQTCKQAYYVGASGGKGEDFFDNASIGVRPLISLSSISGKCNSEITMVKNDFEGRFGFELIYGAYPQTVVSLEFSNSLENLYQKRKILPIDMQRTIMVYETNLIKYPKSNCSLTRHLVYEYDGCLYIRFVSTTSGHEQVYGCFNRYERTLSDGRVVEPNTVYWVRIDPIIWKFDIPTETVLSKKILFAGVPYHNFGYCDGNFNEVFLNKFMNAYFAKDIENRYELLDTIDTVEKAYYLLYEFECEEFSLKFDSYEHLFENVKKRTYRK